MIEYQGWATVREAYREADEDQYRLEKIINELQIRVKTILQKTTASCFLEQKNGVWRLVVFGNQNHITTEWLEVLDLFKWLADAAPGSYGMLGIHDDESPKDKNEIVPYVLKKGTLVKMKDFYFSPYFEEVEEI